MKPFSAQLPNGLEIIAQPMPAARSVAMALVVRVGARDDQNLGAAHFLEHMLFKGSATYSALELSSAFDAIGAHANAFTSHETTTYTASGLPQTQSRLTELLLGMMQPRLDVADLDLERQVILEEIELYRDDPMSIALETSAAQYFLGHPLGRPVIGTKASLSSQTKADLQSHLEQYYSTSNMVLAVCGVFDWQRLLEDAAEFSQLLPQGQRNRRHSPDFSPQHGLVRVQHDSTHTHVSLIAKGFAAADQLELPAAIAARIIGDSENSRLAWALVDDGTAVSASLEHEGHSELGAFYGSLECRPEHTEQCLERLGQELTRAKEDGIRESELERIKRKLEVGLALRFETPSAWLGAFSEDYVLQNDLRSPQEVLEELRAVGLIEVNAALEASGLETPMIVCLGD